MARYCNEQCRARCEFCKSYGTIQCSEEWRLKTPDVGVCTRKSILVKPSDGQSCGLFHCEHVKEE